MVDLAEDLKEIDCHLRVKVDMCSIIPTTHEEFNVACNCPTGDGYVFKSFVEDYHPDHLLQHVESTNGIRQDMLKFCNGPIYFNTHYHM